MTVLKMAPGIEKHFFIGSNDFARDPLISPRACKVYIYLVSHSEGWEVTVRTVAKATGMGKNTVAAALQDLEQAGFIKRTRVKDEKGLFAGVEYLIFRERQPCPKNRDTEENDQLNHSPKSGTRNDQEEQDDSAGQSQYPQNGTPENGRPESGSHKKTNSFKKTKDQEDQEEDPPVVPQGGHDEPGTEVAQVMDPGTPAPMASPSGKSKRGTRLAAEFMPSQQTINTVRAKFPGITPAFMEYEHEKFHNHFTSAPGSKGLKLDWEATWRNWMYTSIERLRPAERAAFSQSVPAPHPQPPATPTKSDQYYDIGSRIAAEFAQGAPQ